MNPKLAMDSPQLTAILGEIVDDLIDSCIMDGIFTMHRAIKLDYFHVIAPEQTDDAEFSENGSLRLGVHSGRESSKTASCCRCVKCHSKVAATRRIAEQQRLEDFDDEADEDSTVDSPAAVSHSEASNTGRCANGVNKHHSPLKLTISLVSVPGKSETGAKHVVRAVNVNHTVESTRTTSDSRQMPRSAKTNVTAHKSSVSGLHKTIESDIVLKEARVTLTSQDIHFPENITG
ncbi:unnamed protein product [Echinostoma caproni]|uniref:Pecanex-like protein n=1 Tax=Echinostoma caproni TaxID=27848 RepID=A0A183BE19_9TREM|nr:unnamed protein product [Echinostoma caproni]